MNTACFHALLERGEIEGRWGNCVGQWQQIGRAAGGACRRPDLHEAAPVRFGAGARLHGKGPWGGKQGDFTAFNMELNSSRLRHSTSALFSLEPAKRGTIFWDFLRLVRTAGDFSCSC